jgi:hypothetical protein
MHGSEDSYGSPYSMSLPESYMSALSSASPPSGFSPVGSYSPSSRGLYGNSPIAMALRSSPAENGEAAADDDDTDEYGNGVANMTQPYTRFRGWGPVVAKKRPLSERSRYFRQ